MPWRFVVAVMASGIAAGIVGWAFGELLHIVEYWAWGRQGQTLIEAARLVSAQRRFAMLVLAGVIAGLAWTLIHRFGRGIVRISDAVKGWTMPLGTTATHATTQVVIVGLGASIGREVAPREMSAALSAWIADQLHLSAEQRRIVVACAAGAGLAAVYSIPLSGAVFALEVLLVSLSPSAVWPAFAMSGLAVVVAHGWERGDPFYAVPALLPTASLVVWAIVAGPILGVSGHLFGRAVRVAEKNRPTNWHLLISLPLTFTGVGLLAMWVPEVLGNGQASAQQAFDAGSLSLASGAGVIALVMVVKALATLASIRAGAWGGTLTPALAIGACAGALLGIAWSLAWPGTQIAACAFIGAAAFLGTSMRAPLTALVLLVEFTHQGTTILVPAALAIAGAVGSGQVYFATPPTPAAREQAGKEHPGERVS